MRSILNFIYVIILLITNVESYKILFYNPKIGPSHMTFMGKIADTLAAAGHDVVVYQPILNDHITFTGSKHKNIRYHTMPKNQSFQVLHMQDNIWEEEESLINMMSSVTSVEETFCSQVLNDVENLAKLKAENFDLGFTEFFEACGIGIFYKIGLKKYITTFAGPLPPSAASSLGIKIHPSYVPGIMSSKTDQMTFYQRVETFIEYFIENIFLYPLFTKGAEMAIKKDFSEFSMNKAIADSAFYFVNSDEHVDYAMPITHKIIYIAGLGKVQAQPLEKKYADIFNSAAKGVILFSFGSNIQSYQMPPAYKHAFLEAFSDFPEINFIWKYEKDEDHVAAGYPNVFTEKRLPQNDILENSKNQEAILIQKKVAYNLQVLFSYSPILFYSNHKNNLIQRFCYSDT